MAVERRLSASSQNQAICAPAFLYETVLAGELQPGHLGDINGLRSNRPRTLPTILSTSEVRRLLAAIPAETETGVIVRLLHGTGMRMGEACTLRVRDVYFDRGQVVIRQEKGNKHRWVMLPEALRGLLIDHLRGRRELYERDVQRGAGYVPLPDAVGE